MRNASIYGYRYQFSLPGPCVRLVGGAFRPSAYQIRYEAKVLVRDSDLVISEVLFAT